MNRDDAIAEDRRDQMKADQDEERRLTRLWFKHLEDHEHSSARDYHADCRACKIVNGEEP